MIKRLFTYLYGNFNWNMNRLWSLWKKNRELSRMGRRMKKAKRIAMRRHKIDGKRYYILPDHRGDLCVVNNKEIETLKKAGIMNKQVCIADLLKEALWFTPSGIKYAKKR